MAKNDMGPLQEVIGVHWATGGHRYFLGFAATFSQAWDGGGPAFGDTMDIVAATSPYFPSEPWVGFRSGFGNSNPATLTKHPSNIGGIVSEQPNPGHSAEEGQNIVIHSISMDTLRNDDFIQVLFDQFDDHLDVGPGHDHTFAWQVVQNSFYNLNLFEVGDSATFTAQGTGSHFSAALYRMRDDVDYVGPLDLGGYGEFEFTEFGPFSVLLNDPDVPYPLTITRIGQDDWELSGFEYNGPDQGPGWYSNNDPFPPP
jgi:hypothetical protein